MPSLVAKICDLGNACIEKLRPGQLARTLTRQNVWHTRHPPVVHRDLTGNNELLVPSLMAKICDLGNAYIEKLRLGQLVRTLTRQNVWYTRHPPAVHRDLTANNILQTPSLVAKISDLGNACIEKLRLGQLGQDPHQNFCLPKLRAHDFVQD